MSPTPDTITILGFNLSNEEQAELLSLLPGDTSFSNAGLDDFSADSLSEDELPWIMLFPWRELSGFTLEQTEWTKEWARHRVLLLDPHDTMPASAIEKLMDQGFLAVMRRPLSRTRLLRIINQASEVDDLYLDIYNMTREIELEREILSRKNAQLTFLNRILTRASQSLDVEIILQRAVEDLSELLEVSGTAVVFWEPTSAELADAELFISFRLDAGRQHQWIEYLLENVRRLSGFDVNCYHTNFIAQDRRSISVVPDPGQTLVMPFGREDGTFGALTIITPEADKLGQDRLSVIKAAVNHLSLALRNALHYRSIKRMADHDGLTRLYNRQHFDKRVKEELKRHQRQGHQLSLLMLDLDRFKHINDTHGHQAGDLVLRELGRLLLDSLRETDFPARYGGEEFVVILPHTTQEQARVLAERIRKRLAAKRFRYEGTIFRVTGSIGIATIKPASLQSPVQLIRQADQALYMAKAGGRNMVCTSAAEKSCTEEIVSS